VRPRADFVMTEHGGSRIATGFGKTVVSESRLLTDILLPTPHRTPKIEYGFWQSA
jgi:hypothetical protein